MSHPTTATASAEDRFAHSPAAVHVEPGLGTVPNGCPQTQLDALKAVVEGVPFACHQADRKGLPCHGWFAGRVAVVAAERHRGEKLDAVCPWEFSDPDPLEANQRRA